MSPWKILPAAMAAFGLATPAVAQMASPQQLLSHADANHDGRVTRAEFLASRASAFDRLDSGGRGYVPLNTVDNRPRLRALVGPALAAADLNHDGRVTRAEFVAAPTPVFDTADANHDGVVDPAEANAFAAGAKSLGARSR